MPKKKNSDSLESLQAELDKAERKKKYYEQQEKILTRAAEADRQKEMTLQFADGRVAVTRKGTT